MSIPNPEQAKIFHDDYAGLGDYVTDDTLVPYYNPADSGVMIQQGEPVLVQYGPSGENRVFLAQKPIRPGQIGMLHKYFTVDLPCDFSANVVLGQEIVWDIDDKEVKLVGDVTNGFVVGDASYHMSAKPMPHTPAVDGNDRVICATDASTKVRVVSRATAATITGTVGALSAPEEDEGA